MDKFAPVLQWEDIGFLANGKYLEMLGKYRYCDGYSHLACSGSVFTSYTRTENGQTVIYVENDDYSFDRYAPDLVQHFDGPFEGHSEPVRYGFFVNDTDTDFSKKIASGIKKYETRTRKMLDRLINNRVAIIRTGKGKPVIVGYCWIVDRVTCSTRTQFDGYRDECCCDGTSYGWTKETKVKHLYQIVGARECVPHPLPGNVVRHGRSWVEM